MAEERLRKIGIEKVKVLNENFDELYETYRKKALESGLQGELRFKKQHGRVFIYVVIWHIGYHTGYRLGVGGLSKSFTSCFDYSILCELVKL